MFASGQNIYMHVLAILRLFPDPFPVSLLDSFPSPGNHALNTPNEFLLNSPSWALKIPAVGLRKAARS